MIYFFSKIAWQKTKPLTGFHGRPGEHNFFYASLLQHGDCHGHGKVGFASAGWANGKNKLIGAQGIQIILLGHISGSHGLSRCLHKNRFPEYLPQIESRIIPDHFP